MELFTSAAVPFFGWWRFGVQQMTDLDRLRTLARASVQAAHEADDTATAAMLLDSAHRFLNRANPELGLKADEFNRGQMYRRFSH
jgi:hypothetical protein